MKNTTKTNAHAALYKIFEHFKSSDGLAYHHIDGDLSFKTLQATAKQLAHHLVTRENAPILIYGHKHRRFIIAYWAAILSGRAAVPVEAGTDPQRLRQIAKISGASQALIADPDFTEKTLAGLPALPVSDVAIGKQVQRNATTPREQVVITPEKISDDATAYILFSSGTTGQPKGISISYKNLANFVAWTKNLSKNMDQMHCISGNVKHCFDVSLFEFWFSWLTLKPISSLDHRDLLNTAKLIERYQNHKLSTWVSTPTLALLLTRDSRFNAKVLPHLHTMLFCGEVLPKSLVSRLWQRFPHLRIINTYGPTECTVAVTSIDITQDHMSDKRPLPIGNSRQGTRLSTSSTQLNQQGELIIQGQSVGKGYLGDPKKQTKSFPEPATYLTGDYAYHLNGCWYFEGRRDREIKLHGHRIDLNMIEDALRNLKHIDDVVVNLHPNNRGLRAFILGIDSEDQLIQTARTLAKHLPDYMLPRFWYGTRHFSLNNNGKLDHKHFTTSLSEKNPVIITQNHLSKLNSVAA